MAQGNQGINIPDDPNCIERQVRDSGVWEYYALEEERNARLVQLVESGRNPVGAFAHVTKNDNRDVFGLYWQEPREIG